MVTTPREIDTIGKAYRLASTIDHLDVAPEGIGGVVVVEDAIVEAVDDPLAILLGALRRDQGHEVISADMTDKGIHFPDLVGGGAQAAGAEPDDLVTPHESVVIVEGLEIVEIAMDQGER